MINAQADRVQQSMAAGQQAHQIADTMLANPALKSVHRDIRARMRLLDAKCTVNRAIDTQGWLCRLAQQFNVSI